MINSSYKARVNKDRTWEVLELPDNKRTNKLRKICDLDEETLNKLYAMPHNNLTRAKKKQLLLEMMKKKDPSFEFPVFAEIKCREELPKYALSHIEDEMKYFTMMSRIVTQKMRKKRMKRKKR